jgi:hypothetical protein
MTETRVEADFEKEAIKTEFKKQVFIPGLRIRIRIILGKLHPGKAGSASALHFKCRSF